MSASASFSRNRRSSISASRSSTASSPKPPASRPSAIRAQRDELLVDRSTRAHHRLNSTTLADSRFELSGASPSRARRRPLKAERRQTRLIFLSLLVLLATPGPLAPERLALAVARLGQIDDC